MCSLAFSHTNPSPKAPSCAADTRRIRRHGWAGGLAGLGFYFCASVCFGQPAESSSQQPALVDAEEDAKGDSVPVSITLEVLEYLESLPVSQSRRDLRRAARSEASDVVRAKALGVLASRDPSAATARICGRALRTDPVASVRRAGAECLGNLPQRFMVTEQVSLVGALEDENLDVVNMAGWALARTDGVIGLEKVRQLGSHPDPRVAKIFQTYGARLEQQAQSEAQDLALTERRTEHVRKARSSTQSSFELALGASWLALYGGLSGYLHGGLVPLGHLNASDFSVLSALSGGIAGFALGGTLGLSQKLSFNRAHAIVQIGSLATIAGYSSGWLSETGAARGLHAVSYGLMGSLLGNGLALSLVHFVDPSPGALALGALSGSSLGFTTAVLAAGYGFSTSDAIWAGLWTGSISGLVTTVVGAPFDWASLPIFSATVFGCVGAMLAGFSASSSGSSGFVQAWAIAGGYGVGAAAGALIGFTLPSDIDPFQNLIHVQAPSLSWLPAAQNATSPQPVVTVAGSFSM